MKLFEMTMGVYETEVGILGIKTKTVICGERVYGWALLLYFPTLIGKSEGDRFSVRGYIPRLFHKVFSK